MYKFILYYEQKASYKHIVKPLIETLEIIRNKWNVDFNVVDTETLQSAQVDRVKSEIRNILPQARGKIVSAKNKVLPFSKTKNLNTGNTPILVLYRNETPVNVYPHMLGATYFEIEPQLENILENGPEAHMTAKGILEEPMQKILADDPSILERGMRFIGANRDVGSGVADVLLQDAQGKMVIVEIETKATETAVAQVSRLAAGYAAQDKLPLANVRKIILCQHFDTRSPKACRGANVELYRLTTEKVC
jgi:hypothetical protein